LDSTNCLLPFQFLHSIKSPSSKPPLMSPFLIRSSHSLKFLPSPISSTIVKVHFPSYYLDNKQGIDDFAVPVFPQHWYYYRRLPCWVTIILFVSISRRGKPLKEHTRIARYFMSNDKSCKVILRVSEELDSVPVESSDNVIDLFFDSRWL